MMGAKETSPPEERPRPEDDPSKQTRDRTLGRASLPAGLDRVQVAARRFAPYPVHGVAAPCRRGRAIARVSAAAARGQRGGRRNRKAPRRHRICPLTSINANDLTRAVLRKPYETHQTLGPPLTIPKFAFNAP